VIKIVPFEEVRTITIAPNDACGKKAVAVIKSDATMIPICSDCLNDLKHSLNKFINDNRSENVKIKRIS
jgi:hypothetical protein